MGIIGRKAENRAVPQELLRVKQYPEVAKFFAYGVGVTFRKGPLVQGEPDVMVGEMHFLPFGNASESRALFASTIAAGVEGMYRLFKYIAAKEAEGTHIRPSIFIGITNKPMAEATQHLGCEIVPLGDRNVRRISDNTKAATVYAVLGDPQVMKQRVSEYRERFGGNGQEGGLVRRARMRNPQAWSWYDENGQPTEAYAQALVERQRRNLDEQINDLRMLVNMANQQLDDELTSNRLLSRIMLAVGILSSVALAILKKDIDGSVLTGLLALAAGSWTIQSERQINAVKKGRERLARQRQEANQTPNQE